MMKKFTSKPIKKAAQIKYKNDEAEEKKAEEKLDEFYSNNANQPEIQKPVKIQVVSVVTIFLAIIFALGASFFYDFIFSYDDAINGSQKVIIDKQEEITVTTEERLDNVVKSINPVVVNFYSSLENTNGPFYQDTYSLGTGFILTSDGWIATSKEVLNKIENNNYIILTADYKVYEPVEILEDPISPVVFIKIEANNLPVIKFGSVSDMISGQKVYGFIATYPYAKVASLHLADLQTSTLDDVVASTEEISHFVSAREGFNRSLIGSPVVNLSGEIIALIINEKVAIPTEYLNTAISDLSKKEAIDRAYLGLHYINLSKYPEITTEGEIINKGALLSGIGNLVAVEKNSPAQKAGLKVGDIITMVEDELVNGKKTLTQIIQDYDDGETLKFTITRNGEEKIIEVKLDELK